MSAYQPQRVNKSIELLERGQPIYYDASTGGYEEGLRMASTWGDYIIYNVEHVALDFAALREFMRGLVDAGPTPSGHRTPTVIVSLPLLGLDEATVQVRRLDGPAGSGPGRPRRPPRPRPRPRGSQALRPGRPLPHPQTGHRRT